MDQFNNENQGENPTSSNQNPNENPSGFPDPSPYEAPSGFPDQNPYEAPSRAPDQNPYEAPSGAPDQNPYEAPSGFPDQNSHEAPSGFPGPTSYETPSGFPAPYQNPPGFPVGSTEMSYEAVEAKKGFDKVTEQIRNAVNATIAISAINILLGAALTFIPSATISDVMDGLPIDTSIGFGYVLFGLAYLALSFGVLRRSRIFAALAMLVFLGDTVYLFASGGFANLNVMGFILRGALIVSLITGLIACIRYHILMRRHRYSPDGQVQAIVADSKPRVKTGLIIAYVIFGGIGIAALIYGATSGAFSTGRNFEDWEEYQFRSATVQVPHLNFEEEIERIPNAPGVYIAIAVSETRAVAVTMASYVGFGALASQMGFSAAEFEQELLSELTNELGMDDAVTGSGSMAGRRFQEVSGHTVDDHPIIFRALTIGDDIYVLGVIVQRERDMHLIDSFFDSVVLR